MNIYVQFFYLFSIPINGMIQETRNVAIPAEIII